MVPVQNRGRKKTRSNFLKNSFLNGYKVGVITQGACLRPTLMGAFVVVVVAVVDVVTLKDLPDLHSPVEGHLMRMSSAVTG